MLVGYLLLLLVALCNGVIKYDGYKVIKVTPTEQEHLAALRQLEQNPSYGFWTEVVRIGQPVHVMVPPHLGYQFEDFLAMNRIQNEVFIENVQEKIDKERPKSRSSRFDFNDYHRVDTIYSYLNELAELYPDNVKVVKGGSSYEGLDLKGIHISFSKSNENRSVFLEGGIHAREWISPATVMYIGEQVLKSKDAELRKIVENYDWYIFPVLNPDGYEYSHVNDRLWRSTRSENSFCKGADANRNWGFHWKEGGSSSNQCSETYAGKYAFSEIETKTMSEYITSIHEKLMVYLSFHSFSQLMLIPYGLPNMYAENYNELYEVGLKAADKIKERYGTQYTVGNIVDVIYVASGSSVDWIKGTYNTRYTYALELRDTGNYGFFLPTDQIVPTGEETLDGLLEILREALKRL